jgi:Glycosyltransferases involved in cell wall biogenesis
VKCISVVIPSYNASKFLLKAINSVKNQTYLPKELIVIDDGSTDNTKELLKDIKLPFDFRLLTNEKNKGRSYSRNLGAKESAVIL